MKSNNHLIKNQKYQYNHIYDIFTNYFKIEHNKYEYTIKDIIKVLIEYEKRGETIIDLDKVQIDFDLYEKDWPEKHIKDLYESGLLNLLNSPLVLKERKISWSKWSIKLERVKEKLYSKIDLNKFNNIKLKKNHNYSNLELLNNIFIFSNILLLEGGPGTGKTTLVVNLILNYLKKQSLLNIGLGAPTGKATARLKEALNNKSDISNSILDKIECQTLHTWIYNSSNKSGKLKFKLKDLDLLIIDEASMLSVDILETFLDFINKDCKVVLVGDANQLPPINNCSIWNNIFENKEDIIFKSCTVNLKKIYRNNGNIEKLSKLIFHKNQLLFNQKANEIINLQSKSNVNIEIIKEKNIPIKLKNEVIIFIENLKSLTMKLSEKINIFNKNIDNLLIYEKDLVIDIFNLLNSQLILCPRNTGYWSVKEINSIIIKDKEPYDFLTLDEGIPIMCIENNNELGISNGDIGVLIGKNNTRRFLFRKFNKNNEPVFSLIEPNRLENIVPAIAITIHKSQGSESKNVKILWKQDRLNSDLKYKNQDNLFFFGDNYEKRLLYTAITRAKESLDLYYLN